MADENAKNPRVVFNKCCAAQASASDFLSQMAQVGGKQKPIKLPTVPRISSRHRELEGDGR